MRYYRSKQYQIKSDYRIIKYICKQDKQLLQPYPQGQIENPYAGPCYRCPTCNTVYDSSLVKLPRQPRPVNSSIGGIEKYTSSDIRDYNEDNIKGLNEREDEYDKYNPEENADEMLRLSGAKIIESRIELTDSSGT